MFGESPFENVVSLHARMGGCFKIDAASDQWHEEGITKQNEFISLSYLHILCVYLCMNFEYEVFCK